MYQPKPIVLLVSGEYPPYTNWGGNAYQLANVARLLNREGYEVEVIAESDNGEEFTHLDEMGNLVHRINGARSYLHKTAQTLSARLGSWLGFRDLAFALRVAERAWELVHLWNRKILWVETTNWRAETLFFHLLPQLNARTIVRTVTPMEEVVRQNQIDRSDLATQMALLQETAQQLLLKRRLYSNHDYRDYFESRVRTSLFGKQRADEKVFLLPFDFDRVPSQTRRTLRKPDGALRLLMVGRVEPRKGFDMLCSALSGLSLEQRRTVRVVAAGRDVDYGPFNSYKRLLLEKYPSVASEQIEFLGAVPENDFPHLFETVDIGLVASTSESFGYNLVELIASDLPVITSEVGAASEFERRGIRYLGKFQTTEQLRRLFGELPRRYEQYANERPKNRERLAEIYAQNDRSYLAWARASSEPAAPVTITRTPVVRKTATAVKSVDLVVCSYNRFEELTLSLPSLLREAEHARASGIDCAVTIVFQNEGLPERIYTQNPELTTGAHLRFVPSSPPSLTRARNTGVRNTNGDLVIFVDDDVVLEPGFVAAHVEAATATPSAIGVVGRIRSRIDLKRTSKHRAVGQFRPTGFIDTNFDSVESTSRLVPHTPMGANMAYRRAPMVALFGESWFDERFTGSAFREESTLAVQIFRHGHHFVYAPNALLYHYESVVGGCGNRGTKTLKQLITHYSLDYLFLNRLYEPMTLTRLFGPLLLALRDLPTAPNWKTLLKKTYVHSRAYWAARRLHAAAPKLHLVQEPSSSPRENLGARATA
ncbi:MAG: glycosyltransferase [Myxococcota bacterium]